MSTWCRTRTAFHSDDECNNDVPLELVLTVVPFQIINSHSLVSVRPAKNFHSFHMSQNKVDVGYAAPSNSGVNSEDDFCVMANLHITQYIFSDCAACASQRHTTWIKIYRCLVKSGKNLFHVFPERNAMLFR